MALDFTEQEREFLLEVLSQHRQGLELAKESTIEDLSLDDMNALLDCMADYDQGLVTVQELRRKIEDAYGSSSAGDIRS
jgi:hypothetical protein